MDRKIMEYNKMPIKTIEEIAAIIDANIPTKYTFNENTEILVINSYKNSCYAMKLDENQTNSINEYDFMYRGGELYKIFLGKSF